MMSKLTVIGVSAGGVDALKKILVDLNPQKTPSIVIVTHIKDTVEQLMEIYKTMTRMTIKEAEDGEKIKAFSYIYFAPANYHLSVEAEGIFSLSLEEKVNYVRPSIDILFESAAEVYQNRLSGIILTGANNDGAKGLKRIEELGGQCIVQSPEEAFIGTMPNAAIQAVKGPKIMLLNEINDWLCGGVKHGK